MSHLGSDKRPLTTVWLINGQSMNWSSLYCEVPSCQLAPEIPADTHRSPLGCLLSRKDLSLIDIWIELDNLKDIRSEFLSFYFLNNLNNRNLRFLIIKSDLLKYLHIRLQLKRKMYLILKSPLFPKISIFFVHTQSYG